VMIRFHYPRVTMVIALILGELAERSYHQSLSMGDGSATIFFTRTTSLVLFIVTVSCLLLPAAQHLRRHKRAREATP
jgi:putative tricarboxylic transport membrane protein